MALSRAARAIQAGDADVIACMSADVAPIGFGIGSNFSSFARDHIYPYGAGGMNSMFALITSNYMRENGATAEDFGRVCIAQRANGIAHKQSMFKKPLSMEEYLSARLISDPLRLYDCVPRCCAGEAFLVMSEDRARSLESALCDHRRRRRAHERVSHRPRHVACQHRGRLRKPLRAGRHRTEGYRLRAGVRRLSGHRDDAARSARILQTGRSGQAGEGKASHRRWRPAAQHKRWHVVAGSARGRGRRCWA